MPSSGMWRRVDLILSDVSEGTYRLRLHGRKIGERGTIVSRFLQPPAHDGSSHSNFSALKTEALRSSETSVQTRSTWRHAPKDGILHSHRRENLRSYLNVDVMEQNSE
jgi:hypothetical protein